MSALNNALYAGLDKSQLSEWLRRRNEQNAYVGQELPTSAFVPEGKIVTITIGNDVVSFNAKGPSSALELLEQIRKIIEDF